MYCESNFAPNTLYPFPGFNRALCIVNIFAKEMNMSKQLVLIEHYVL